MSIDYFGKLAGMPYNTRKRFRMGDAIVWVDREQNGNFTVLDTKANAEPVRFTRVYDASRLLYAIREREGAPLD